MLCKYKLSHATFCPRLKYIQQNNVWLTGLKRLLLYVLPFFYWISVVQEVGNRILDFLSRFSELWKRIVVSYFVFPWMIFQFPQSMSSASSNPFTTKKECVIRIVPLHKWMSFNQLLCVLLIPDVQILTQGAFIPQTPM